MDLLIAFSLSFILLIFSVFQGYFIAYPLLISIAIFLVVLNNRGFKLKRLIAMAVGGSKKSFSVLTILLLIGALIGVWMAAGTVPAIVFYGIKSIVPEYFILAAFILSSLVSLLIGTSFGTVGTIGIALIIMANSSAIDNNIVAAAIISGAYVGDRCSPMSSSANLVASLTKTKLYTNIKNMLVTGILPFLASAVFYGILSPFNSGKIAENNISLEIGKVFNINPIVLLPAIAILILSWFRVEVKISMLISMVIGVAIALSIQDYSWQEIVKFMVLGFNIDGDTELKSIFIGGGLLSMLKVSIMLIVSTALAGILVGTRSISVVEVFLKKAKSRSSIFLGTIVIATVSAAFGCTQTIAIILTDELVKEKYEKEKLDNYLLALDLENTAIVISALIPWNMAGLVPATLLNTGAGFIPYACYLYLIPIWNSIQLKRKEKTAQKPCN